MSMAPTQDELAIFNDITRLGESLWAESLKISGLNTDPKMFSIMLYKRLWSNHRGFALLWNNSLPLEADIVLRAGIEAAICIAACFKLGDGFLTLMRQDAAHTVMGQIKVHRANDETDLVRDGEATLRDLTAKLPEGTRPVRLNWQSLARDGGAPQLYDWHRMLSGVSSHVTGLSVLRGVVSDGSNSTELQSELRGLTHKMHLMMMAGATLQGSMIHAGMIDNLAHVEAALALTKRMDSLSMLWPGVAE